MLIIRFIPWGSNIKWRKPMTAAVSWLNQKYSMQENSVLNNQQMQNSLQKA